MQIGMGSDIPPASSAAAAHQALIGTLTSLVRRIPHAGIDQPCRMAALSTRVRPDPAVKLGLITLANQAMSAMKAGEMAAAADIVERLRQGLDSGLGNSASLRVIDDIRRALAQFEAAARMVDTQIGKLRAELCRRGDPQLRGIDINDLTEGSWADLQPAIANLRASLPVADPGSARLACRLAGRVATDLSGSEKVRAIDDNSLGVPVSIAATLGGAARRLHEVLREIH